MITDLPIVKINKAQQLRIIYGSPWVYSNEISNFSELKNIALGSLVKIAIEKNNDFAIAYFNPHSLIACRILSYDCLQKIDVDFFNNLINQALKIREKFFTKPYYRLIHSEGDFLPGLIIDRFDKVFVCQISTAGMDKFSTLIIASLLKIFGDNICIVFKNDIDSRKLEKLELETKIVHGTLPEKITVFEDDLEFQCDIILGQKTGWFFDQYSNHKFIKNISNNLKVLDCFCYCGGFGVNALAGNAQKVVFVDSSPLAIEITKNTCKSLEVNNNYEFHQTKVFDYLEHNQNLNEGDKFDLIILDPPAFIKSKKDYQSGLKGYEKLVKLSLGLLKNNAILMLNSCSHHASQLDLINCVKSACYKSNRKSRLIRTNGAGIDHPVHLALKENEYLKSLTFFIN